MKTNFTIEKCTSIFLLHALGDTIGFKNGDWEFNSFDLNINDIRSTLEIISEFVNLGGITNINLKNWLVSDDTLLNYEIAKFILNLNNETLNEKHIIKLKKEIIKMINYQLNNKLQREFGVMTAKAIQNWTEKNDERSTPYNPFSGGNGCAMRTLPIGIRFYQDSDLDKLIEYSIETSKLTHNSPIGFLGGLATAYFIKLAINNISIDKWPFMLIKLYESPKVKKYINIEDDNIYFDYRNSIKIWKKFVETVFDSNEKPYEIKSSINLLSRFQLFIDLEKMINTQNDIITIAGGSGQTAVIMAYFALLDSKGQWEKLVYYSMLHGGDSDTVGAIAGGFYGAVYGMGDVQEHLLKYLEMKEELIDISKKIYELSFNKL
jgi:ADP-ribosylglycohydrolase